MLRMASFLGVCLISPGCSTQAPQLETSAAVDDMTHDGLFPIRNAVTDRAWARQDLDLSGYNKIMLQTAGVHYRPIKRRSSMRLYARGSSEFPLDDRQKARVRKDVLDAFVNELEKGEHYAIVQAPGPDVLIVRGALLDAVSYVPPERVGRIDTYLDRVGEATLIIELIDSQSEAVLVRAVDRRVADQHGFAVESNSVTNAVEVRRTAQIWARRLRENLDRLSENMGLLVSSEHATP